MEPEHEPLLHLEHVPTHFDHDSQNKHTNMAKIAFILENTQVGRYWDLVDACINAVLCMMYLVLVSHVDLIYVDKQDPKNPTCPQNLVVYYHFCREIVPISLQGLDAFICVLLFLCVFTRAVFGMNMRYFSTFNGILTVLTCIPPLVVFIKRVIHDDPEWTLSYLSAQYVVFFYPIRWFRLQKSLKVLLLPSRTTLPIFASMSLLTRKIVGLTITITLMLLTVSCYIHIFHVLDIQEKAIEDSNGSDKDYQKDKSFWETFFFTIMSATSGLSTTIIDVNTPFIQFLLVSIMIAGIFYLPPQISSLINVVLSRSSYSFPYKPEKNTNHVVISGTFSTESLIDFLYEFYHQDHGYVTSTTNAVILNPEEPDEALLNILNDPMFSAKLCYIKGSSADMDDLNKASIQTASACFILCTSNTQFSPNELDSEGLMRCIAVHKSNPTLHIYTQCLVPDNKPHFKVVSNKLLCIDDMKFQFLAQSCKTPGFSTLFHILTSSISETKADDPKFEFYAKGLSQEFYCIPTPHLLVNTLFKDACRIIYHQFHSILFAIANKDANNVISVVINPNDHILKSDDILIVISDCADLASKIPMLQTHSRAPSPTLKQSVISPIADPDIQPSNLELELMENALPSSVQQHILLLSNAKEFPRSLALFITSFRLTNMAPIVITSNATCPIQLYRQLSKHKNVYFIKGSPLINYDLKRSNCHLASQIVILGSRSSSNEYTLDATSIMTLLNVQQMKLKSAHVMVELMDIQNSAFISMGDTAVDDDYLFEPSYYGGQIFSRSMIDVQLCQSYYNPYLLQLLRAILINGSCKQVKVNEEVTVEQVYLDCLQHGKIAFGVFRFKEDIGYMCIPNPDKHMIVSTKDLVFVFDFNK